MDDKLRIAVYRPEANFVIDQSADFFAKNSLLIICFYCYNHFLKINPSIGPLQNLLLLVYLTSSGERRGVS